MLDGNALKTEGMVTLQVKHPKTRQVEMIDFYIAATHKQTLVELEASLLFGLLTINDENICALNLKDQVEVKDTPKFVHANYKDLFEGYGKLDGKLHLDVDPAVCPVQCRCEGCRCLSRQEWNKN